MPKQYFASLRGVQVTFKTPHERLKRLKKLHKQREANFRTIDVAVDTNCEILTEIRLLLPRLDETRCKCGQLCITCMHKRMEKLKRMKDAKETGWDGDKQQRK